MQTPIPEVWQDLTALERDILTVLALNSPCNISEVHRHVQSASFEWVSRKVSDLEAQDLIVTREDDDDGRVRQCALTAIGREAVRAGVVDLAEDVQTRLAATVAGPEQEDRV